MSTPFNIHDYTPAELAPNTAFNYLPTQWITILFVTLYSISTLAHAGQATYYRMWWLFPTAVLAGCLEIAGWGGRLWATIGYDILNFSPFQLQIVATIIAPTPLVAANFIILGRIINCLGPQYSRLTPKLYAIIFCSFDIVSLVVQGVGGGIASSAVSSGGSQQGANIMLGGIAFQMFTITAYSLLASEFIFRYLKNGPLARKTLTSTPRGIMSPRIKIMIYAMMFNTTCLFIRAVYRVIELSDGWSGRIISTQRYFNWLDGGMITLAIYTLNFFHPGFLLGSGSHIDQGKNESEVGVEAASADANREGSEETATGK